MTEFAYKAAPARAAAAAQRGRIDAKDAASARHLLRERGLVPLEVRPVALAERFRLGGDRAHASARRLTAADRVWFFRTLDRFLSRNASLEEAVRASVDLARTPALRSAAETVLEELRQGRSLAEACETAGRLAPKRHAALLRVGHASGRLPRAAALAARSLESAAALRRQIIGQLIYPGVVLATSFVCVWILAAVVVPRIAEQLEALGAELPAATRWTLAGTRAFIWAGPVVFLAIAAAVLAWRRGAIPERTRTRVRRLAWRLPVWRELVWSARGGVAAETISTLLEGGGELLEGLELAREAVGDPVLEERLDRARKRIREGGDAATVIAEEGVLPPEPAAIALIGSRSGDLAGGMQAAAQACAEQRETLAGRLATMINPVVMLAMGAVVGWLFYSLLTGMLAVNDAGAL